MPRLDLTNPLNSDAVIANNIVEAIGLGMSKDKMIKFKIGEFDILGLVCSGNDKPSFTKPTYTGDLKCHSIVQGDPKFDGA